MGKELKAGPSYLARSPVGQRKRRGGHLDAGARPSTSRDRKALSRNTRRSGTFLSHEALSPLEVGSQAIAGRLSRLE